jgi:hypothetical protein
MPHIARLIGAPGAEVRHRDRLATGHVDRGADGDAGNCVRADFLDQCFERSEVRALPGSGILDRELELVARIPGRAIISAPYLQIVRDRRDNRLDPTSGSFSVARFEFANAPPGRRRRQTAARGGDPA